MESKRKPNSLMLSDLVLRVFVVSGFRVWGFHASFIFFVFFNGLGLRVVFRFGGLGSRFAEWKLLRPPLREVVS